MTDIEQSSEVTRIRSLRVGSKVPFHPVNGTGGVWDSDIFANSSRSRLVSQILETLYETPVVVFATCFVCALLLRYSSFFVSVIDWDESLYVLMAERWLEGSLPYEAVWDQHSVGLPAFFAAILYIFPKSIAAIRLSSCIAVAATATNLYFITRMLGRGRVGPCVAAALYLAWTARLWGLAANTEIYMDALIVPAMYLLIREFISPSGGYRAVAYLCSAALLLGAAFQVKHVAVAETALFFGVVLATQYRTAWKSITLLLASIAFSFLLPTLVVVAYFYMKGLLPEYLRAVVTANLVYMTNGPPLLETLRQLPRSFLLPVGLIILAAFVLWKRPYPLPLLILGWAIAACIDVALPGQFWLHYFLLLMPPAAILAGCLFNDIVWARKRFALVAALAILLIAINPIGIYSDAMKVRALTQRDVPQMVADVIKNDLSPGDFIFVVNYQPVLYSLVESRLPTRNVFPADWSARYRAVAGVDPIQELETVFGKHPKFVIFVNKDWLHMGDEAVRLLRRHLSAYEEEFEIIDQQILPVPVAVEVFRRKSAVSFVSSHTDIPGCTTSNMSACER